MLSIFFQVSVRDIGSYEGLTEDLDLLRPDHPNLWRRLSVKYLLYEN